MCFTAEKLSRSTFHTVIHAMYKLITELLCYHSDVIIVQTHLDHIRNTILTEVSLIIEANDSTKVLCCLYVHTLSQVTLVVH